MLRTLRLGHGHPPIGQGPSIGSVLEAALAANFSHVQLWAPTTTNEVFVHVHQLLLWTNVAARVGLYWHGTALTDNDGTSKQMDAQVTVDVPLCQVRSQTGPAVLPAAGDLVCMFPTQAGVPLLLPCWFHRVANNSGWVLVPDTVEIALHVTFWWQEHVFRIA